VCISRRAGMHGIEHTYAWLNCTVRCASRAKFGACTHSHPYDGKNRRFNESNITMMHFNVRSSKFGVQALA
jgi:hypothetical protein